MNICFLYYSMQSGGGERGMALLSHYAISKGAKVSIITMDDKPSFYKLDPAIGHIRLGVARASKNALDGLRRNSETVKALRKALQQIQPDVVVGMAANYALLAMLARKKMKYRVIGAELTNPYLRQGGFWNRNKGRISAKCDGYLFQTEGARGYYPEQTQRKSIILPNGIEIAPFEEAQIPWEQRRDICAVGRMDQDKCFDDLLYAFATVHEKHPDVKLDLYGDGPVRPELEKLAQELGIGEQAVFHGRCTTIHQAYARHKLFAMSSQREGMPNVLLEALGSGCACVSSNCNFGPSELIREGENGFLVPVHDRDLLAKRICELLEDEALCRRFSDEAMKIRETHSMQTIGAKFMDYLNTVVNDTPRR